MKTMFQAVLLLTAAAIALPGAALAAPPTAKPSPTAVAPASPASTARLVERTVTLADLGFADGISFTGFSGRRDLYFPLPVGVPVRDIKLAGGIEAQAPQPIRASMQILVDDRPRWNAMPAVGGGVQPLALDIIHGDAGQPFVKVSFLYGAAWSEDRCMDQRLPGGYATLRPDTVLHYRFDPAAITSVRDALAVLPRKVRIALSAGNASRDHYEAALALGLELTRQGRKVEFVRLPTVPAAGIAAEFAIAPMAELAALVGTLPAGVEANGTVRLVMAGGLPVIALTEGADVGTVGYLASGWHRLAGGAALTPRAGQGVPAEKDRLGFAALGLGDGIREVADRGEWDLRFDYAAVPKGQKPSALDITLTPGAAIGGDPQLAHIFVNNLLLRSVSLADGGATRRLSVPLPDGLVGRSNALRVVLQRQTKGGDCREAPMASPAQLLPDSGVVMAGDTGAPGDFFALGAAFADGLDVVVPAAALADPAATLALATRALDGLVQDSAGLRVVVDDGKGAATGRPFLLLPGVKMPAGLPVALDQGAVKVVDRQGRTLLDVTGAPTLLLAQLAQEAGQVGLVLQATGAGPVPLPETLPLDRGTVAFADADGLLMAIDTVRERAVKVEIGDNSAWADWLDRFRILLVAGIWVLLTGLVAGGFAKWYRARNKS